MMEICFPFVPRFVKNKMGTTGSVLANPRYPWIAGWRQPSPQKAKLIRAVKEPHNPKTANGGKDASQRKEPNASFPLDLARGGNAASDKRNG
jgi:hypothetical protein